jgi:hypothetical protein
VLTQASPSPAPFKTITRIKSSPVCTAFRELVLPLAIVQQKNHVLIQSIQIETVGYRKYSSSIFRNGQTLHGANIDMIATSVLQNIAAMDRLLAHSWQLSPKGTNPKVDALRQRVQNVVDLQRAIANKERQFGAYLPDTEGMDLMTEAMAAFGDKRLGGPAPPAPPNAVQVSASSSPPPPPEDAGSVLPALGSLAAPPSDVLPEDDPVIPSAVPRGFTARRLPDYSFTSLQNALRYEGLALTPVALSIARDCDGVGR